MVDGDLWVAKPAAEAYGWWAAIAIAAICFPIAFWIEARDKRRRREAEQAVLRAEAARLHAQIVDSLRRPPAHDVIDADYTVVDPGRRRS